MKKLLLLGLLFILSSCTTNPVAKTTSKIIVGACYWAAYNGGTYTVIAKYLDTTGKEKVVTQNEYGYSREYDADILAKDDYLDCDYYKELVNLHLQCPAESTTSH